MFTELIKGNCLANRKRGGAMRYCAIKEATIRVVYRTRTGEKKETTMRAAFPEHLRSYDIAAMVRRQKDPEIETVVYWSFDNKQLRESQPPCVFRNVLYGIDKVLLMCAKGAFVIAFSLVVLIIVLDLIA